MNRREFLKKLEEYLSFELPERLIEKHVQYYAAYISEQTSAEQSEAEVIEALGDPQLIARSIIDAEKAGADGIPYTGDDRDFSGEIYGDERREDFRESGGSAGASGGNGGFQQRSGAYGEKAEGAYGSPDPSGGFHGISFNTGCLGGFIILVVILVILASLLSFLWPYLLVIGVVMAIAGLFKGFGGR